MWIVDDSLYLAEDRSLGKRRRNEKQQDCKFRDQTQASSPQKIAANSYQFLLRRQSECGSIALMQDCGLSNLRGRAPFLAG